MKEFLSCYHRIEKVVIAWDIGAWHLMAGARWTLYPSWTFSWSWQWRNPSFSLPWRKWLSVVRSHRTAKMTNLFGSSLLPGFLLINREIKPFPEDRKVSLANTLKSVNSSRNLSKAVHIWLLEITLRHRKTSRGHWVQPITKAAVPL